MAAHKLSQIRGRTWVFSDDYVNTDAIMPRWAHDLSPKEEAGLALSVLRPGWAAQVRDGDILVAGRSFGIGSSRAAVTLFLTLGIGAVVGESVAEIFFRNCVSYGLPVMECPGVLGAVKEGERLELDLQSGVVMNLDTRVRIQGTGLPSMLLETIRCGGVFVRLEEEGYLAGSVKRDVQRPGPRS